MAINNQPTIKPRIITGLFTKYIAKTIPLAFDESMSYYECICALLEYLNKTIVPDINNTNEGLSELQSFYLLLQDYVNEYFDVEFPAEIASQLDEMAEDGTLENLLNDAAHLTKSYDTYTDMIADSSTFTNGLRLKTLGYNSINDGGGATYYVSNNVTSNYQINLSNGLYLNLINIEDKFNIKTLGYSSYTYTENEISVVLKDITSQLQNLINYYYTNNITNKFKSFNIYFPSDEYYIDDTIDLKGLSINLIGDSVGIKHVGKYSYDIKERLITNVDGIVFNNGECNFEGLNIINIVPIVSTATNDCILSNAKVKTCTNCWIWNYDIVFNAGIQSVGLIQNNQFMAVKKYFLKSIVVDSDIINNYINGEGTNSTCIYGNIGGSRITNNFIDFFKYGVLANPIAVSIISDNIFDYCYHAIEIGGAEGLTIDNNNFYHICKAYYNNANNNYTSDSEEALNDWICIKLNHTQKGVTINNNTGSVIDLFIHCYNTSITAYTSIHSSGNTINRMANISNVNSGDKFIYLLHGHNNDYNNQIQFEELNNSVYSDAPTKYNTCNFQEFYYNGVKYKNVNGKIITIAIASCEEFKTLSFTDPTLETSQPTIDLTVLPQYEYSSNIFLEIINSTNYSEPQSHLYKINRVGNHYSLTTIVDDSTSYVSITPNITNGILKIVSGGSVTDATRRVSYRTFGF